MEFASGIFDGFLLPYVGSYCTYADLKSLNIEKCKPNSGLIDVLQRFLLVTSASDKIKIRVSENIWKQLLRVALQNQILANIECQRAETPNKDTFFSDISEILSMQFEKPFSEIFETL